MRTKTPVTLHELLDAIEADNSLTSIRRRDLASAVRRTANLLGKSPEALPADLAELRPAIEKIYPVLHNLSPKSWQNVKSTFLSAIRRYSTDKTEKPGKATRSPEWQELFSSLPDKRMKNGLSRFFTWCSKSDISPKAVDDSVMEEFRKWLETSTLVHKQKEVFRRTCRLWNEAVEKVSGWPDQTVTIPDQRLPRKRLPLDSYPQSFVTDLEKYLAWAGESDLLADDQPRKRLAKKTLELRRTQLELAAAMLVQTGTSPSEIHHLADLVKAESFKTILRHYLVDNEASAFCRGLAIALVSVARDWVKLPSEELDELQRLRRKLGTQFSGLTIKNRTLLRQLNDDHTRARLLGLSSDIRKEAKRSKLPPRRIAIQIQLALAVELLLHAPIRRNNLVSLNLETHLCRPGGTKGLWYIVLPAHEVKNREALEYELPRPVTELLDTYLKKYRPLLCKPENPYLFPGEKGHKSEAAISQQINKLIKERVGIHMTIHQFRHFAARMMLQHSPEAYAAAGQLLGHKNLKTTTNFYAGIDTVSAGQQYDSIMEAERKNLRRSTKGGRK